MRCRPGHCIVCDNPIVKNGRPAPNFMEDELLVDNEGDQRILLVAHCNQCELVPPNWDEVLRAVNAALAPHSIGGRIVAKLKTRSFIDVIREAQGNRCRCGNTIDDTWIMNNGEMLCGKCNRELNGKVVKIDRGRHNDIVVKSNAGRTAREYNERHPRRAKKTNV